MASKKLDNVINLLKLEYPDAKCTLNFDNALELLVATVLSAQCTDARVNQVTKAVFKKYRTTTDYANASLDQFEKEIYSTGFYKNKAKNIIATCKKILSDFNGQIPKTMNELTSLPGLGRKTANVILGNAFNSSDGIVVDTHVSRLSQRLGWTEEQNPYKIENDLIQIIPKKEWIQISHILIEHGRTICKARNPKCHDCVIQTFCPSTNTLK